MALSLSYAFDGDRKELNWYVGNSTTALNTVASYAVLLMADGHELQHIRESFENIPRVKSGKLVQTWFGDDAKFIAANL